MQLASYLDCEKMVEKIDVSARAAAIEYAIRDVVVPAMKLEGKAAYPSSYSYDKKNC